jgi:hypothetical protein
MGMAHRGRLNVLCGILRKSFDVLFEQFSENYIPDTVGGRRRRQISPRLRIHPHHHHRCQGRGPPRRQPLAPRDRQPRRRGQGPRPPAHPRRRQGAPQASCPSSSTATPPSPARASWPRRSTSPSSRATAPAAPSTSSSTTRSASPPTRRLALDPLLHRRRQDDRGPDLPRERRRPRGRVPWSPSSRSTSACSSSATSSSTCIATASTATTRPTSRPSPSRPSTRKSPPNRPSPPSTRSNSSPRGPSLRPRARPSRRRILRRARREPRQGQDPRGRQGREAQGRRQRHGRHRCLQGLHRRLPAGLHAQSRSPPRASALLDQRRPSGSPRSRPTSSPTRRSSASSTPAPKAHKDDGPDRLGLRRGPRLRHPPARRHARPSSAARTASAARSATATPSSTTWKPTRSSPAATNLDARAGTVLRLQLAPLRGRRARLRLRLLARLSPTCSASGRPSSATSPTAPRSSSTSSSPLGESKWQRTSGIVLLLPHGYEGQGPEHSSARLERFLQLCAEDNIQVANITTPGQLFHVLRRQMKRDFRKPLVIMSPKSLLRHPAAVSPRRLHPGSFQELIIDEFTGTARRRNPQRVILCSGKVYYDLCDYRAKNKSARHRHRPPRAALPAAPRPPRRDRRRLRSQRPPRLVPGGIRRTWAPGAIIAPQLERNLRPQGALCRPRGLRLPRRRHCSPCTARTRRLPQERLHPLTA